LRNSACRPGRSRSRGRLQSGRGHRAPDEEAQARASEPGFRSTAAALIWNCGWLTTGEHS
jgi:hypothetical protein